MFAQAVGAQTDPLKVFMTDPGLAAVLAEGDLCKRCCKLLSFRELTDKLLQSVLGGMLTEEGG